MTDKDPLYKHDCDRCEFLGSYSHENNKDPVDLYFHGSKDDFSMTVVARLSDDPPDYSSGIDFAYSIGKSGSPLLIEARKRAVKQGLLTENTYILGRYSKLDDALEEAYFNSEYFKGKPECPDITQASEEEIDAVMEAHDAAVEAYDKNFSGYIPQNPVYGGLYNFSSKEEAKKNADNGLFVIVKAFRRDIANRIAEHEISKDERVLRSLASSPSP